MDAEVAKVHSGVVKAFRTKKTLSYDFRISQLEALHRGIIAHESDILAAVSKDLGRGEYESYIDLGSLQEINYFLKNLKSLMFSKTSHQSLMSLGGEITHNYDPLGHVWCLRLLMGLYYLVFLH